MRPLSGIRVIDLTRVLAGPFAAMLLGDLGAEVIKIEQPGSGDDARGFGPFKDGVSGYFMSVNRGKRGMTLNLKHPKGKEILRQLVGQSDVLVENFRPGVMDRLGLGYEALAKVNPRLIYAATSGFGQTGPYAGKAAYDMIVQGMSGIMSITGEPDGEPVRVGTSIADLSAALFTVTGVLAALYSRERTGRGQMLDVAMLDSVVALLENAVVRCAMTGESPKPLGARHPAVTPFEMFKSKDGHVILALSNEAQWQKFIEATGARELAAPEFATNPLRTENHDKLKPLMDAIIARKTTAEWIAEMEQIGIACGP
ncbi:MAG: CoA transferase, partial [Planctomycetes bacterium]|nr:CoA transferase [Planctomycetota bacterium]